MPSDFTEVEKYSRFNTNQLADSYSGYYFTGYSTDPESVVMKYAVINWEKDHFINEKDPVMIVTSVSDVISADGEVLRKVTGFRGTKAISLYADDDVFDRAYDIPTHSSYSVKKGDFIKYSADEFDGYVTSVQVIFRSSDEDISNPGGKKGWLVGTNVSVNGKAPILNPYVADSDYNVTGSGNNTYFQSFMRVMYGWVYSSNSNIIKVVPQHPTLGFGAPENDLYFAPEKFVLTYFNARTMEVRQGEVRDLKTYKQAGDSCSRVIILQNWGMPVNIVIIDGEMQ